ncbi:hypothetical protein DY000_02040678 [Brassica cretica]|uniref:Uncharacterized protein n=1 Tax=Brassica cretica TaxID=69181 RepID=A0ABQ7B758_BRACR|nr:hypothetical protein DY000_02040678 [Brassica cretica]
MAPPSREKYSASEKGKGVMKNPAPSRDQSLDPKLLASAIGAHRDTLSDAPGLILGQSALIFDIQEQFREDGNGVCASDGEDQGEPTIVAKGVEGRPNSTEADGNGRRRLTPFRLSSSGSIEKLLDLHSESSRPSVVAEQGWGDVLLTFDHPNTVVYPEDFWYEVHKIMALSEKQWKSFDRIRILDWASNIPCEETKGKRMPLPLMGKITRAYPSYSDIGCREFQFHDRVGRERRSTTPLRNKPPNKAKVRSEEEEPGPGMSCEEVDHSIDKIGGEGEDVRVENPKGLTGKKRKRRPKDIVSRSADDSEELVVSLPAGRRDGPLVNDQAACSNLTRQIRGGTRMMPEVTEVAFLDNFSESARTDSAMTLDLCKAETGINTKDAEFERAKGEVRDKAKDLITQQKCFVREREQAIQTAEGLEEILETAQSRIAQLEKEKGGLDPPPGKLLISTSERVEFLYEQDGPLVNDQAACSNLTRQIRGGTRMMPEVTEVAFLDNFSESARTDSAMTLDLCKAETGINTKDAEFERAKGEVRDKAKDLITQQKCFVREREQAIQTAEGLEEILETAQSRIAQLEKEKVEAAEKTKMEMARMRLSRSYDCMRLSRLREVTSERDRIMVAEARRFEKFQKYMADRDKLEEKLFLFSQASGTLQSMDTLEEWGMQVPKKLKDLLTANEINFKKEAEEIVVEVITEQDLVLSPPRPEPLRGFDQFGSNIGTGDPATASSLRYPLFEIKNATAIDRSTDIIPEVALEGPLEPASDAQTEGITVEERVIATRIPKASEPIVQDRSLERN